MNSSAFGSTFSALPLSWSEQSVAVGPHHAWIKLQSHHYHYLQIWLYSPPRLNDLSSWCVEQQSVDRRWGLINASRCLKCLTFSQPLTSSCEITRGHVIRAVCHHVGQQHDATTFFNDFTCTHLEYVSLNDSLGWDRRDFFMVTCSQRCFWLSKGSPLKYAKLHLLLFVPWYKNTFYNTAP